MSAAPPTPMNTHTPLPLAETFFAGAIHSGSLAHGYVLKGKNTEALYNLALQIAKVLNCTQRPSATLAGGQQPLLTDMACGQCKDCRWVAQNAHPAVLTISRLTYQVNEKGELMSPDELEKQGKKASAPTQIKTDQVGRLIQQLGISSQSSRVVIFTDVEELPATIPSNVPPPFEWQCIEANEAKSFHVRPLDRSIFNAFSVNKFLKTLEEPPQRTVFFFITETEEQLLETIVSRCQVVPCLAQNGGGPKTLWPQSHQDFLDSLFRKAAEGSDVYGFGLAFERFFIEEQGLSNVQALNILQLGFRQWLEEQPLDEQRFVTYRNLQQELDQAIRKLEAKTNESQTLLNLFIKISQALRSFQAA
ncbi:hypothetical protein [Vampirovibrio sp.]|uniref:hypothetical protein n=1 Tax=Vampirovibrio sp. TaxID=2717857 RepID=UPI003592F64E